MLPFSCPSSSQTESSLTVPPKNLCYERLKEFICSRIKKGEGRREKKTSCLSHVFLLPKKIVNNSVPTESLQDDDDVVFIQGIQ